MERIIKKTVSNYKVYFTIVSLFLSIAAIILYVYEAKTIKHERYEELHKIVESKVLLFSNWISERNNDAKIAMDNPRLSNDLQQWINRPADGKSRELVVDRIKTMNSGNIYDGALLFDINGKVKLTIGEGSGKIVQEHQRMIREAVDKTQVIWGDFYYCSDCKSQNVDIFIPLKNSAEKDGKTIAVLMLIIAPQRFLTPLIELWPVPSNTSEIMVLRQNELKRLKTVSYYKSNHKSSEPLESIVVSENNEHLAGEFKYHKKNIIAAIEKIPGKPWYLVAKTDRSEAYQGLNVLTFIIGSSVVFMISLMGALLALVVANQKKDLYKKQYDMEVEQKVLIKHFDYITKYANDIIFLVDSAGRIVMTNDRALQIYGYSYDETLKMSVSDFRTENSMKTYEKDFNLAAEEGGNLFETEHRKKDGSVFPVEISLRKIEIEGRKYFQAIIRDITERKFAEAALQMSEYRYRTTLDAVNEMIHVIDRDYTVLLMNRTFMEYCRDNGLCEQCVGKKVFEMFPFLPQRVKDEYEKVFATKETVLSEDVNTVNGKAVITKTRKIPIIENDEVLRIVTIITDVTDAYKQQAAIKESQEKYRSIYDNSKDGIFLMKDDTFVDCNQALLSMFAMESKEDIIGKTPGTTSPEYQDNGLTSREYGDQLITAALSGQIMRFEWKHKKKTGEIFDCDISLNRLELKGEYYLMAILRDITDKKENEIKLRESEKRYSIIMEKTGQLVYDYDINSEVVKWAGAANEVTGYSLEDLNSGRIKWEDALHPDDSEFVLTQLAASRSAVGSFDMEYRFRRADGIYVFVSDHGIYMPGPDGKATKMLGTMEDISERKRIDIALKQSEERYKTLFTDTLEALSITKEGRIYDVNSAWLKLHRYKNKSEVIGRDIAEFIDPRDREFIEERRNHVFSNEMGRIFEIRDMTKDRRIIDVEVSSSTITLDGDLAIISAIQDITQRKINEKNIRELNRRFEYVLGATLTGFDIIDADYNLLYVDPAWEKTYGSYPGAKCYHYFMGWDLPCEGCGITKALATKQTTITEEYLVKEKRWIEVHTIPFQNEDGKWLAAEFNIDITRRKHDQQVLENRQRALQEVYKIATSLDETFQSICDRVATNISQLLNVPHMAVQLLKDGRINVISYFGEGKIQNNFTMPLEGTPCEKAYLEGKYLEVNGPLRQLSPKFFLNEMYDLNSYLGMPIKDKKGKTLGLICIYDYRQHHYTEEELLLLEIFAHYIGYEVERNDDETKLREADKNKLLSDIASGVAHEVRNPLHAIQAISEAMAKDIQDNPDYAEYLKHIKIQVSRLSQLMKELLELGKPIQASGFKKEPIYDMIMSARKYWQDAQPGVKNTVIVINNLKEVEHAYVDVSKIQEVVINLLDNAIHHSPDSTEIIVEISEQGRDHVLVKITDRGTGIIDKYQGKVFEPFFTTRNKGTGLGLTICKRIIESHGGNIQISNNEQMPGCTVQFTLPIYTENEDEASSSIDR